MQGGVSDVLNLVTVEIKKRLPYASIVYTCHDAATWEVPAERAHEAKEVMAEVATKAWDVQGVRVAFPAKFKPIQYGGELASNMAA